MLRRPAVVLVCGGMILLLALGIRQSFGLFLRPMSLDLGWGRETFSFAIALQNLVWGLAMPFAGAIADRFPAAEESTLSIGAALAEAMAHRGFWLLTASFFVCGFQTIFVMTHLPAYLVDRGLSATEGMAALATIGLFNIVGSYA